MTLDELEACFQILLLYARQQGRTEVDTSERDFYWVVAPSDWLTIYAEPKPGVGSFSDDEAELTKLLEEPSRASAEDLERLAHMLQLLGESLVGPKLPHE